jgi:hypothetical protein
MYPMANAVWHAMVVTNDRETLRAEREMSRPSPGVIAAELPAGQNASG